MLELTLVREDGTPFAFQFENDALQTFLEGVVANKHGCRVVSVTALGSGKLITHELPPAEKKATLSKPVAAQADAKSAAKPDAPKTLPNVGLDKAADWKKDPTSGSVTAAIARCGKRATEEVTLRTVRKAA